MKEEILTTSTNNTTSIAKIQIYSNISKNLKQSYQNEEFIVNKNSISGP